jgi:hypothetical protein
MTRFSQKQPTTHTYRKRPVCGGPKDQGRTAPAVPSDRGLQGVTINRKTMRQIQQIEDDGFPPFLTINELLDEAKKDEANIRKSELSYRDGYLTGWLHCARAIVRLYRSGYVRPRDIATLLESHDADLRKWRDNAEIEDPLMMGEPTFRRPSWANLREQVFSRDGRACTECGSKESIEAHHVEPVAEGGISHQSNLTTLCRHCHRGF